MRHPPTILRSTRVVTPDGVDAHDVALEGERVVAVAAHGELAGEVTDLGDLVLMPALIDAHVHCNEPGRTEWEGFASATRAAAAGGIQLLVDMPLNSDPVTVDARSLAAKQASLRSHRERRGLWSDVALYGGLVPRNASDPAVLDQLCDGGVAGIKAFLCPSGLDSFPPVGAGDLEHAMPELARLGVRLLAHAELGEAGPGHGPASSYTAWLESRPPALETRAIRLLLDLCARTGCAVHVVHVACAEALPLLAEAKQQGLPVTAETCPHYLTFDASEIPDGAPELKCAPPLRHAAHREALWQALQSGVLDFVATDHSPCPPAMKHLDEGNVRDAWGGISSLQLLLPAVWTGLCHRSRGTRSTAAALELLHRWLCAGPAQLVAGSERSALRRGALANLVVWDPEATFTVRAEDLFHRHAVTPYEGLELAGRVEATYLRGELVYERSRGLAARAPGRAVRGVSRATPRTTAQFEALRPAQQREHLEACCGSRRWLDEMTAALPAPDLTALSDAAFAALDRKDWLEAFGAHPQIGDLSTLRARFAHTERLASGEQSATAQASDETLEALARMNADYLERFGYIFIVFATGKGADEMLALGRARLANDPATELEIAAGEQRKITTLRLDKMLQSLAAPAADASVQDSSS